MQILIVYNELRQQDDFCPIELTFEDIGKAIGRDEVWVAAAFYGQVRLPSYFTILDQACILMKCFVV